MKSRVPATLFTVLLLISCAIAQVPKVQTPKPLGVPTLPKDFDLRLKNLYYPADQLSVRSLPLIPGTRNEVYIGWHQPQRRVSLSYKRATDASLPAQTRLFYQVTMTRPSSVPSGWRQSGDPVAVGEFSAAQTRKAEFTETLDMTAWTPQAPSNPGSGISLPGEVKSLTGTKLPVPVKLPTTGNLKPVPNSRPALVPVSVAARLIERSGTATYYLRVVGTDANGNGVRVTDPVPIHLGESLPAPDSGKGTEVQLSNVPIVIQTKVIDTKKNTEVRAQPSDFGAQLSTEGRLTLRYVVSGASGATKLLYQISAAPFPTSPGVWRSPALNKITGELPLKSDGEFAMAQMDWTAKLPKPTKTPRRYYIRLVALKADGSLVAQPSPMAYMNLVIPDTFEVKSQPPGPPPPKVPGFVTTVSAAYIPQRYQTPDDAYRFVTTRALSPKKPSGETDYDYVTVVNNVKNLGSPAVIPVGTKLYLPPGQPAEKDVLDYITGFFKEAFEFVTACVNWASQAYTDLQNGLVVFVADATGLPEDLVRGGLQFAMAALGLPPTLPNMDQLMDQGLDYLAEQAVAQIGVPQGLTELSKDAMKAGLKEMANSLKSGGPPQYAWKPDPDYGNIPARLTLKVTTKWNAPEIALPPADGVQLAPIDIFASIDDEDGASIGAGTQHMKIFERHTPVPRLKDGESVTIPLVLQPEFVPHYSIARKPKISTEWRILGGSTSITHSGHIDQAWSK